MIAKRGVKIDAVYFHAPPYTSERAKQKVVDLAKQVAKYSGPIYLHVVNFTDIQLHIYEKCPHDELTIIMRRYMMRIAERIAAEMCIRDRLVTVHVFTIYISALSSNGTIIYPLSCNFCPITSNS